MSTGAIDSPKLLMLSGIGPAAHLREHGIEVLVDSPGVGEHLQDHPEGVDQLEAKQPMVTTSTQWWEIGIFTPTEDGLDRPDLMMHYGSVPFDMNTCGTATRPRRTASASPRTSRTPAPAAPSGCAAATSATSRKVDPRYFTDPEATTCG